MLDYIHHYTTIDTLAKILSSKKLRFNRLDQMDDVRETKIQFGINFGKYFFISCWTHSNKESIPQWHMYAGGMKGIRISLPILPFKRKLITPNPGWDMKMQGKMYSPLSLDEQYGSDYMVLPMFMNPDQFGGPVEYCTDADSRYAEAIKIKRSSQNKASLTISRPFDLVRLKSPDWSFQQEYRYFLFIMPSLPIPSSGPGSPEFHEKLPSYILNAFLNGKAPSISYIDVDLSNTALSQLIITIAPLCSKESKQRVKDLVATHIPEAQVIDSKLMGTIRKPEKHESF
jgi:hypothetical protein